MKKFNTPILFIVFNRPDTTIRVFEKIRQIKPLKLYVAGDGPREGYDGEKERVSKVREIATRVDWACDIKTLYHKKNLGCKKGCLAAIDWFFENEEKGIILEDDCLPHLDFFNFCENLLNRYVNDERVSLITGNNFQNSKWRGNASYYFSKFPHIWGWATWRYSWQKYDVGNMKFWPEWKNSRDFLKKIPDKVEKRYWKNIFDLMFLEKIDTWCYPLSASIWYRGGLTATPNVNLVTNIGFGVEATHTKSKTQENLKIPYKSLGALIHPKKIARNIEADNWVFNNHYGGKNLRFPFNFFFYFRKIIRYLLRDKK
jgi:hypothetical protein